MQIQVNTDHNLEGREALIHWVEAEVRQILDRFSDHITRVEVHLSDENSGKSGGDDKRCLMEARISSRQPLAVHHHAGSLNDAFSGAAEKMKRSLESALGRLKDHHGRDSIRGNEAGNEAGDASQTDEPITDPVIEKQMS
jgi:ribosome-associated translation inhibitor RaiA